MEYSIDNGSTWTRYNGETLNFNEGTYVLVRYSENSNYFASHYVELEF